MKSIKIKYDTFDMGNLEFKKKHINGEVGSYILNWRFKRDGNWRNFPMPESLVFQLEWHALEQNLRFAKALGGYYDTL